MKNKKTSYISYRVTMAFGVMAIFTFVIITAFTVFAAMLSSYGILVALLFVVYGSIIYWTYQWVYKPYKDTAKALILFKKGYIMQGIFELRCPLSPEFEGANHKFKEMMDANELINVSKKQAEYLALQNQINPHFLYNTLEGIRGEAIYAGIDSVAEMTEALSTFFRYTISNMENLVTLEDELANIENYYIIQQFRFGERINLSIEFDGENEIEILKYKLPKLTLQPIVENSIHHGIERKVGKGHVKIKVETTPKRLIITVSDDGMGIESAQLTRLNKKLNMTSFQYIKPDTSKQGGIAIVNVNNRIKLLFGEEYGIHILSTINVGTHVEITLPLIKDKDNMNENKMIEEPMKAEVLRLENVTLKQNGMKLLDNINMHIFKGEIMGLLPINTHGKATLLELLCKNNPIDYGRVYFNDRLVNYYEHSNMDINRVYVIEQESKLVSDLTVVDNIFVLRRGFKKYFINQQVLDAQLKQFTKDLDIQIDSYELAVDLTDFERCVVELLKAVIMGIDLIIIHDISNFLSTVDLVKFQNLMRYYCNKGISFLYVGNHHQEAFKICDRVTLMENSKILKVLDKKEFSNEKMLPYIISFDRAPLPKIDYHREKRILSLQNIYTDHLKNISFSVEKGECVVVLDMNNTVFNDFYQLLNGEKHPVSGTILLEGKPYTKNEASDAIGNGVVFIGENPIKNMLFQDMDYLGNLCFLVDKKLKRTRLKKRILKSIIKEYEPIVGKEIYTKDIGVLDTKSLYNLVYYRIHLYNPKVVFCFQPFSGADMYLRRHVVDLIDQLKQKGIAVVILAVSISDSLTVADKLLVINNGYFENEYNSAQFHRFQPKI